MRHSKIADGRPLSGRAVVQRTSPARPSLTPNRSCKAVPFRLYPTVGGPCDPPDLSPSNVPATDHIDRLPNGNRWTVVFGAIRELGRSPDQIKHLIFTHGHPDLSPAPLRSCGKPMRGPTCIRSISLWPRAEVLFGL